MPWKETCRMDERVRFIGRVLSGNAGMAALCREFGISRKTDYKWLERYRREVMAGLAEHSHAPLRHGRALDVTVVQAVLGLRERWPRGVPASCARSCRSATRSCRCRRRARSGNRWAAPGCSGGGAASPLARLYAAMRLFVNFFQPSFKLASKVRDGALVRKRYHPPATPCQRLMADPRTSEEVRRRVQELRAMLDPVRLLKEIRAVQQRLVEITDRPALGETAKPTSPTLEQFLSGLRSAWREGDVRPASVVKAKPKRSRRRPDPFAAVTAELRGWFEAEPWHTSRELLERLQAERPSVFPDGQLRTLQRRLKEWRREAPHRMVFGTMTANPGVAPGDGEGSPLSSANDSFSDGDGGAKSPVDLPLRLDDAHASPTTPQGQRQ